MVVRRFMAALSVPLVLVAAIAEAQVIPSQIVGPVDAGALGAPPSTVNLPTFRAVQDPIVPSQSRRDGLVAAYRVRDNLTIGVGRFAVPPIARPRTNMERDSAPMAVQRRDRGMAAVGMSLRF